jgi:DNA polymerase-4
MDAFYASVEIRDRPELAGSPVVVGGTGGRGVVLSASYQARAFGVRSAMPVARAQRMCPRAVFVAPRRGVYAAVSKEVMAIFGTVTPEVEPLALDEAFLDVSGALRRLGSPAVIAGNIRAQVARQQGITCSVGVAPTKFVAKIASARCKPDGLLVVPREGVLGFLHPLPVAALWGVGERTGEVLARLGLRTVADIAHTPLAALQRELGVAQGSHLAALAWGRDERGRGDIRRGHRGPGPDQAGAAQAGRADGTQPAGQRMRGADGLRQDPARQFQDDDTSSYSRLSHGCDP